jgi:hypothetical protein
MIITMYKCDGCSVEFKPHLGLTLRFNIGKEVDSSGSLDDKVESVDLCINCISKVFYQMMEKLTTKEQSEIWQEWRP